MYKHSDSWNETYVTLIVLGRSPHCWVNGSFVERTGLRNGSVGYDERVHYDRKDWNSAEIIFFVFFQRFQAEGEGKGKMKMENMESDWTEEVRKCLRFCDSLFRIVLTVLDSCLHILKAGIPARSREYNFQKKATTPDHGRRRKEWNQSRTGGNIRRKTNK